MKKISATNWRQAPLLRTLFAIAGAFAFIAVVLGAMVHEYFFYFAGFVGLMQLFFALTGWCPMAIMLQLFGKQCNLAK